MRNTIIKVRLLLMSGDKVLLMEQTNENGGKYTLPGGTVNSKEFAKKALIRECKEELGIKLHKDDLDIIHILHKKKAEEDRVSIYFVATNWKKKVKCLEEEKFRTVAWVPMYALPVETSPTVRHVLNQVKMGELYSNIFAEGKITLKKWKKKMKKKKRKEKRLLQKEKAVAAAITNIADNNISPNASK